jgi:hypothetical protein
VPLLAGEWQGSTEEVGGGQGEIKAGKREAHDEYRGAKENCGGATEKMGAVEGEAGQQTSQEDITEENRQGGILRCPDIKVDLVGPGVRCGQVRCVSFVQGELQVQRRSPQSPQRWRTILPNN